ncbi:MAG: hypothetical protein GX754_08035 [Clostridiaceae bacterium]|nr:hypothetical protein [Clostridiaceae bacterium]
MKSIIKMKECALNEKHITKDIFRRPARRPVVIGEFPVLHGNKGQVSIFLTIVFLSLIVLCGILIDAARIRTGEAHVKRSVENAARSALALYNSRLKNDYGLFAMGEPDTAKIEEDIKRYIGINLSSNCPSSYDETVHGGNGENFIDLYGFRVEEVKVTPILSLVGRETARRQALEYLKYRVPEKIIGNLLKKIGFFREIGTVAEAYGKKTEIDESMGNLDSVQLGLMTNISSAIGNGVYTGECVNDFNKNGTRDMLAARCADLVEKYKNLVQVCDEEGQVVEEKQFLEEGQQFPGEERQLIDEKKKILREEIIKVRDELKEKETRRFIQPNMEAVENANKMLELCSTINLKMKELEQFLEERLVIIGIAGDNDAGINAGMNDDIIIGISNGINPGIGGGMDIGADGGITGYSIFPGQDFKRMLLGEVEELSVLVPREEDVKRMISDLENNIRALEEAEKALDEVETAIERGNMRELTWDWVYESLTSVNREYKKLDYGTILGNAAYSRSPGDGWDSAGSGYEHEDPGKADDPRKIIEDIARNLIKNEKKEDIDMRDAGINISELPSNKKIEKVNLPEEIEGVTYYEDKGEYPGNAADLARYSEKIGELENKIGFSKTSVDFSKEAINFITAIGKMFSGELDNIRDKIYINEYILEMFRNHLETGNFAVGGAGSGKARGARESFFNAEVEYILHGSPSENINILKTKCQVLLIRFVLNTLHVYMDAEKNRQAALMASALAGWLTGGAGIPIVKNLLMCAWGMGEAILDLEELLQGKSVPLYKTKKDWKLDLELKAGAGETIEQLSGTGEALKQLSANTWHEAGDAIDGSKPGEGSDERLLSLSYRDYLRLFLLLGNTEEILGRMLDIIEINVGKARPGFKIENSYAGIRVETVISMKYLFLTGKFMPWNARTIDGRHFFRVVLYEMY